MELKEFVKNVLKDLVESVDDVSKEASREIKLYPSKETGRAVEFDIAVTIEDTISTTGKAGIKIFTIAEIGGDTGKEIKNSSVSRIKFGVDIDGRTKTEIAQQEQEIAELETKEYYNPAI